MKDGIGGGGGMCDGRGDACLGCYDCNGKRERDERRGGVTLQLHCLRCGGVLGRPTVADEFDVPNTVQCRSCKHRFEVQIWSSGQPPIVRT